ncbi:Hypothetical predicted protein [Marmota monax]|uniref:Uncharacterized protein n=1 Tax=Marmota monax TaxID=9995 RepID=A0A5E4AT98_MARMO|nr:Hypothetical predicted protein [Marmota monax]
MDKAQHADSQSHEWYALGPRNCVLQKSPSCLHLQAAVSLAHPALWAPSLCTLIPQHTWKDWVSSMVPRCTGERKGCGGRTDEKLVDSVSALKKLTIKDKEQKYKSIITGHSEQVSINSILSVPWALCKGKANSAQRSKVAAQESILKDERAKHREESPTQPPTFSHPASFRDVREVIVRLPHSLENRFPVVAYLGCI